ncbi:hypothetical protein GOV14_02605 [Candidatus Pacearchaeota archaeon]|nr:hypothetical protein [Candidatus Pacearchaeota archaeon]
MDARQICKDYFKVSKTRQGLYDIELQHLDELKDYSSVECHVLIYPFSRKVNSDNLLCNPFEEYVKDIRAGHNSAYAGISFIFNKMFGILMALIITALFLIFWPDTFLSLESVVAVFGAYIIGKELGQDLEMFLVNLTKGGRLQFYKDYFKYKLEKITTLIDYSFYAKKYRYEINAILPTKMNFEKKSNSQIVRMFFKPRNFKGGNSAHILSIRVTPELVDELEKQGFMIGFKICLNKDKFLFVKSTEMFQALKQGAVGCLDDKKVFVNNSVFQRDVIKRLRLRFDLGSKVVSNQKMIIS